MSLQVERHVVTALDTWFVTTVKWKFEVTCEDQLKKAAALDTLRV
jgi:hypothetical protein